MSSLESYRYIYVCFIPTSIYYTVRYIVTKLQAATLTVTVTVTATATAVAIAAVAAAGAPMPIQEYAFCVVVEECLRAYSGVILDRVSFHGRFVHFHLPSFLPARARAARGPCRALTAVLWGIHKPKGGNGSQQDGPG